MNLEKLVAKHLISYYQFPKKLAERYSKILITRWAINSIDRDIDACAIAEDLYQETEDWCTPNYMSENVKKLIKTNLDFPNLDWEEKEQKKEIKELLSDMKY